MNIQEFASKNRIPIIGNFELTRKCPLNCLICYNDRKIGVPEMGVEQIFSIIYQLAELGCLYINLTGGDPLVRGDFESIYEYIISKGICPSVESSLVYLPQRLIELFKKRSPDYFSISLYGVDKEIYQKATQSRADVKRVLQNIRILKETGTNFRLRTPVTKINLNQVGKIAEFAKELDIQYRPTCKIFWKQNGEKCNQYRCTSREIEPYLTEDPVYRLLYEESLVLETTGPKKKHCGTGIYDFNINPYGELNFCITFWKPEYNLLTGSFKDAWNSWYPIFRRSDNDYCLAKELFSDGVTCPWGRIYTDDSFDTSKSLINHAKERIRELKEKGSTDYEIESKLKLSLDDILYLNGTDS